MMDDLRKSDAPTAKPKAFRDSSLFDPRGQSYTQFMRFVLETLGCQRYFEIGTSKGRSLSYVSGRTVAVDPKFNIADNVIGTKSVSMFFQMKSDRFFAEFDLTSLLGGAFDVAFLDGYHVYEYLLRDFMNTEAHGKRNSVVFLHDCLPFNHTMAQRRPSGGAWTGDVWKTVAILRQYRPDLRVYALDCAPTGLIMITGLNPGDRTLQDAYFRIIDEYRAGEDEAGPLRSFCASLVAREQSDFHA